MTLESKILQKIKPTPLEEEALAASVARLLAILRSRIKEKGLHAEPVVVGSVAKGTHLKGKDLDLFVLFPPETPREALEEQGLALGAFLERREKMFAEHPYTHGYFEGLEVEIVPCYRITDPAQKMSAVDRTPFHARFVIERLTAAQKDEVRLLKAFCKGTGTYGAEARIQGFSGYLCELLVLRYGSFPSVLEAADTWRPGAILEIGATATRPFPEPLVVVDPIDGGRNVASALSGGTLAAFREAARAYRKKASERFFWPRPRKPLTATAAATTLRRRGTSLLGISLRRPELTEDVLYPQVHKAHRALVDLFDRHGFTVQASRSEALEGEVLFLFEFEVALLPAVERHLGPPAGVPNAEDFLAKWRGNRLAATPPFLEGDRWAVLVRRVLTTPEKLAKAKVATLSLGKNLDESARRGVRVAAGRQALRAAWMGEVTELLEPRFPWAR